jgi:hypothetical protein
MEMRRSIADKQINIILLVDKEGLFLISHRHVEGMTCLINNVDPNLLSPNYHHQNESNPH